MCSACVPGTSPEILVRGWARHADWVNRIVILWKNYFIGYNFSELTSNCRIRTWELEKWIS